MTGGDPLEELDADLEAQSDFVRERVPVYARILDLLPQVLPRDRLADAWGARTFGAWYERPLLILGALRDDALEEGASHPLFDAVGDPATGRGEPGDAGAAPGEGDGGEDRVRAVTRRRLEDALGPGRAVWDKLRRRYVQTNETSRAVAWLWPAHLLAEAHPEAELELFDVGTSAGLNLVADALPRIWTRADGGAIVTEPLPRITIRRGYDVRPLDPDDPDDARWLRACVWPGQSERLRRLDRAIAAWRDADPRPELVTAEAGDVPDLLPVEQRSGVRRLAVQTVMRDYLSDEERRRYEEGMRRWLESSRPGHALWVELEVREGAKAGGPPATITVHSSGASLVLATCDPHPGPLAVDDDALEELRDRLR